MKELLPYNRKHLERSRALRTNMTEAEKELWAALRMDQLKQYRFYRQKPIGDYIADFYSPKARLVIEVDGGQHFTEEGAGNDHVRDEYMASLGLRILRFTNNEVMENIDGVVWRVYEALG